MNFDFGGGSSAWGSKGVGYDAASPFSFDGLSGSGASGLPGMGALDQATDPQYGSMFDRLGLGMNMDTLNLGLGGLKSIGGLYMGLKQLDLAKKQLGFMRSSANANLENSTQAYNTTLADREKARGVVEGLSPDQVNAYVAQNSLKPRTV